MLAAVCLGLVTNAASADPAKQPARQWADPGNQLDVGVRPSVEDKTAIWAGKSKTPGAGEHGRVYGILSVKQITAEEKLVKPVDERALVAGLLQALDANGFHEFVPGQKPDILLTVSYGRDTLHNPFIRDTGEIPAGVVQHPAIGPGDMTAPTVSINGAFPLQLTDEKTPGWNAKLQKASFEKLYIRITAWEYPTDPKAKSKMLWKTIMVVDDPDHRDLNDVAAKMLEAGAPYFDKETKDPEVDVYKPLPEGHVNVGAPEVGEPFTPKSK